MYTHVVQRAAHMRSLFPLVLFCSFLIQSEFWRFTLMRVALRRAIVPMACLEKKKQYPNCRSKNATHLRAPGESSVALRHGLLLFCLVRKTWEAFFFLSYGGVLRCESCSLARRFGLLIGRRYCTGWRWMEQEAEAEAEAELV